MYRRQPASPFLEKTKVPHAMAAGNAGIPCPIGSPAAGRKPQEQRVFDLIDRIDGVDNRRDTQRSIQIPPRANQMLQEACGRCTPGIPTCGGICPSHVPEVVSAAAPIQTAARRGFYFFILKRAVEVSKLIQYAIM